MCLISESIDDLITKTKIRIDKYNILKHGQLFPPAKAHDGKTAIIQRTTNERIIVAFEMI